MPADARNAETGNESVDVGVAGVLDGGEQFGGTNRADFFDRGQFVLADFIESFDGRQAKAKKSLNDLGADAVDVHDMFGAPVDETSFQNSRTVGIGAEHLCAIAVFVCAENGLCATYRAGCDLEILCAGGTFVVKNLQDFGNDLAGLMDDDDITNGYAAQDSIHEILIVQRGPGNGRTSQLDRVKYSNRCDHTGAACLELNIQQGRLFLFGRVFIGHRPSGIFVGLAELVVERHVIQFDDGAVNGIHADVATGVDLGDTRLDLLQKTLLFGDGIAEEGRGDVSIEKQTVAAVAAVPVDDVEAVVIQPGEVLILRLAELRLVFSI